MTTPLTLTRPMGRRTTVSAPAAPPAHAGSDAPAGHTTPAGHAPPSHPRPAAPLRRDSPEFLAAMVRSLAVAVVEVLSGTRTPATVARWITPALVERIRTHSALRQDLARAVAPHGHTFTASAPRLCRISATVVEAAVVVRSARRHRAVAMRLEHERGRWMVTQFVSV